MPKNRAQIRLEAVETAKKTNGDPVEILRVIAKREGVSISSVDEAAVSQAFISSAIATPTVSTKSAERTASSEAKRNRPESQPQPADLSEAAGRALADVEGLPEDTLTAARRAIEAQLGVGPDVPPREEERQFGSLIPDVALRQGQAGVRGLVPSRQSPEYQAALGFMGGEKSRILDKIFEEALRHNVPWQVLWGILRAETNFKIDAVGDGGDGFGIAQINLPAQTAVTKAQALDWRFSIAWTASKLREGFNKFGDWSLAALAHNSPAAAASLKSTGQSRTGRAVRDQDYIAKVFGLDGRSPGPSLLTLGFDMNDTLLDPIISQDGSGGAGNAVVIPDPVLVRQQVRDFLQARYISPSEDLVGGIEGIVRRAFVDRSLSVQQNAPNPYDVAAATPGSDVGLFFPVPGGDGADGDWAAPRPGGRTHKGHDIMATAGTPVLAAIGGQVVKTNPTDKGLGGITATIKGDDGREYYYAHLQTVDVEPGMRAEAGSQIGLVGNTGNAKGTAPHLHFGVKENGDWVPPEPLLTGATDLGSVQEEINPEARIREVVETSNEYQRLYGQKPDYLSDQEYVGQFIATGQGLLGGDQVVPGEAVRLGLEQGTPSATAGFLQGSSAAKQSKTFRDSLLRASEIVNRLT